MVVSERALLKNRTPTIFTISNFGKNYIFTNSNRAGVVRVVRSVFIGVSLLPELTKELILKKFMWHCSKFSRKSLNSHHILEEEILRVQN